MNGWNGQERRRSPRPGGNGDHDLLIRIDSNLRNFMKRFDEHIEDDDAKFKALFLRTNRTDKFMYLIIGGLVVIQFIFVFAMKVYSK